jgi:hypothetical protein
VPFVRSWRSLLLLVAGNDSAGASTAASSAAGRLLKDRAWARPASASKAGMALLRAEASSLLVFLEMHGMRACLDVAAQLLGQTRWSLSASWALDAAAELQAAEGLEAPSAWAQQGMQGEQQAQLAVDVAVHAAAAGSLQAEPAAVAPQRCGPTAAAGHPAAQQAAAAAEDSVDFLAVMQEMAALPPAAQRDCVPMPALAPQLRMLRLPQHRI